VLAILGGEVVPMEIFGVSSGGVTVGHRQLSDGEIRVGSLDEYMARLRAAFVEPDGEARRISILESARAKASEVGGTIEADADLAGTLANLVEWPGTVRGSFDPEFLELPEEITTTAMRVHQKYLPVRGKAGLLPHFVAVRDNKEERKGLIAKGNEWVLNARLADARFFFEEDTRESLESRLPELSRLTFQDRLGDYRQKTARLEELSQVIAHVVGRRSRGGGDHRGPALEARPHDEDGRGIHGSSGSSAGSMPAAKASRTSSGRRFTTGTACVGDRRFASRASGAIHASRPADTLAGLFLIGLVPTGSKDPYGLRRAALGVVSVVLSDAGAGLAAGCAQACLSIPRSRRSAPCRARRARRFFAERRNLLERRGHPFDEISAVTKVGLWDFADAAGPRLPWRSARVDFRSLILAFKADSQHRGRRRARPSAAGRAHGERRAPLGRLSAGSQRDRRIPGGAALLGGHGDDRLDGLLARSILRRSPRELP
jgi:glycyl-tRNA synthetase beta subunit